MDMSTQQAPIAAPQVVTTPVVTTPVVEQNGTSAGTVVLIVIVIIVIIIIVIGIFLYFFQSNVAADLLAFTFVGGNGANTDMYTAVGQTIYTNNSTAALTLTLHSPPVPAGQLFGIDNSKGTSTITITGATIQPSKFPNSSTVTNIIPAGGTAFFVWKDNMNILYFNT